MTYHKRLTLLILLDSLIVSTAIFIASWIVYPYSAGLEMHVLIMSALALLIFHHLFAAVYKLYNKVWAYASVGELFAIVKAVTLSIIATAIVQFLANDFTIYIRGFVVTWLLHIIFIGGSRFAWRIFHERYIAPSNGDKRTLIVGAGAAGAMIARQLYKEHEHAELQPVAFVDDDPSKQKMHLYNIPVNGKIRDIPNIVERERIEHIVIAIPSLSNGDLEAIIDYAKQTEAKVRMIPKIEDLMTGRVGVNHLKNVELEDLLGRNTVELDTDSIKEYVTDKTVMVTGAGGSIGSEISRQLMSFKPRRILLVGHNEFEIYHIHMELSNEYSASGTEIVPLIGNVQDRDRVFEIVEFYKPAIIYHAAAHKHVPLMEANPHEAMKNNVVGTKNVAEAAHAYYVSSFVLISTDKAVRPTSVMGATKRLAEMIIQNLDATSTTKFAAVRFGNVLGSSGSVIPLFKQQIANGGPVTVTHKDMKRFFMTIPEASRLVIQAGTLAKGGEIFVLDMGEPVRIVDLARNLIRLSGHDESEIGITYTGIRPGEKLYEEIFREDEIYPGQVYEKIYVGRADAVDLSQITTLTERMQTLDDNALRDAIMQLVNTETNSFPAHGS